MWALAVTRPRAETAVSSRLQTNSLAHHVFKHRLTKFIRGRRISYLAPAFPRYIFVGVVDRIWQLMQSMRDFNGNNLVINFVRGAEGKPSLISDREISVMTDQADGDEVLPLPDRDARFKFGDRIRLISSYHVVRGCEGVFQFNTRPGRICILMPWLNQMCSVEVDEDEIEPYRASENKWRCKSFISSADRYESWL